MRPKPLMLDGEYTVVDTCEQLFQNNPTVKYLSADNDRTGKTEIITAEMARNKSLSDYSEIVTNHTDSIRGRNE